MEEELENEKREVTFCCIGLGCSTGPKALCLQLVLTRASCLQLTRTARAPGYIIF